MMQNYGLNYYTYSITNSNTLELLKGRQWRGGGAIALILAVTHEG